MEVRLYKEQTCSACHGMPMVLGHVIRKTFLVVVFLAAIKRLNLSSSSFLSVWDRYLYFVSGETN